MVREPAGKSFEEAGGWCEKRSSRLNESDKSKIMSEVGKAWIREGIMNTTLYDQDFHKWLEVTLSQLRSR